MTKPKNTIRNFLRRSGFLSLVILSFGYIKRTNDIGKNSEVRLYYHLQFPKTDGTLLNVHDSVDVFKRGEYFVYKNPAPYSFSKVTLDKNGNQISEKKIIDTIKFTYIVCKVNEKYGLFFDSIDVAKPKRVAIDSFKHSRLLDQMPYYTSNDSLISSLRAKTKPYLTEIRVPKFTQGHSYANKKIYYYAKEFKQSPIVFSGKLDSLSGLKLYSVKFSYDMRKENGTTIPAREFLFQLKKAKKDPDVQQLIERFKKAESTL